MSSQIRNDLRFAAQQPRRRAPGLGALLGLALLFSILPVSAIATQAQRMSAGTVISLPVSLTGAAEHKWLPRLNVQSPIHQISLDDMTGDRGFDVGDDVFVFLTRAGEIWYPYAVLRTAPQYSGKSEIQTVMLRGTVRNVSADKLSIEYDFDNISPTRETVSAALRQSRQKFWLELAVDGKGRASVTSVNIDGQPYSQRVTVNDVLARGNKSGASKIPPT